MLCPSCRNACLATDIECPVCHKPFASAAGDGDGKRSLTLRFFMPVGAMLGAGAFTVAPIPGQDKIDLGQAAMAGIGGMIGGTLGMVLGLIFEWVFKSHTPAPAPATPGDAFRIGPANRR
jgi:hypothetical protein